ncbi:hypothetical protein RHGRI_038687 [Rhododendron griersonianum]|uniref:ATPase AAA-type core domain-containing protein n=1 Tax=Rhododendron griersonianum TaxID=479676 RepID=A0AAV6HIT8_9ERIC|nr:hypothetical protein RHGRI_038687 [Rhododendron griersonianum]
MAATVSNQKILNDDETVDGGLMAPCRRGKSFDSEISSDLDAPDNEAHLGRPYQSGPNSEKKDMREGSSEECLTKSVLCFDDTTKQKSLPDLRTLTPLGQYFADEENEINDKAVKFYSRQGTGGWGSLKLVHPATLEELGPENKGIISDLLRFVMEKEFYKKVGKAWTGFYSLYEPPGTDGSSLIGAMANYLEFDIYNLDLTSLPSIEELKKMLGSTRNRSLIAIQDFNHWPGMLSMFKTELTVPCLLKIFYHLFSSCGDEHIIVFTIQHRDRHDAALLRPVGTGMHIYTPSPQPLALPEEDDEIVVERGERVKFLFSLSVELKTLHDNQALNDR